MRDRESSRAPGTPEFLRLGGGQGIALLKRLERGALTTEDQALVTQARTIREARRRGKTFRAIAVELGRPEKLVQEFANRGRYRVLCEYLDRLDAAGLVPVSARPPVVGKLGTPPEVTVAAKGEHRGFLARLVPKALRRLELALESGEGADGLLIESKTADHAMDTVLEAAGLLEAEGSAVRPVIHIETLVIQGLATSMREDEARRVLDVTP